MIIGRSSRSMNVKEVKRVSKDDDECASDINRERGCV